jgi:hypothetical protein
MRSFHPKATARTAVIIIGNPAEIDGVKRTAKIRAHTESVFSKDVRKRGQRSPRKAAGTAASSPQAEGLPIACAPRAPIKVKKFQNI